MYNAFEQRPANIDSIIARLDRDYTYIKDVLSHDLMRSISIEMNLPLQDHGNSIQVGNLGYRRDYGASVERLDGARCRLITKGNSTETRYKLDFYTPEGEHAETSGWRIVDLGAGWNQIITEVVEWIELFDIESEKQRITSEIISAVDAAENAEEAFKATSLNGMIYADDARSIYLKYCGVDTSQIRKPREQREAFVKAWEEAHS